MLSGVVGTWDVGTWDVGTWDVGIGMPGAALKLSRTHSHIVLQP